MLTLEDLTNDGKRKQFFQNYSENFKLVHVDKYNNFKYYGFDFEDGSFLTALEYAPGKAIITLTKPTWDYVPVASTMTEIVAHLKNY